MLPRGAPTAIEKQPPRHAHIAQRIAFRNEAVVAHEPMHAIPRHLAAPRLFGQQAIEPFGARAAGEADRAAAVPRDAVYQTLRRGLGESGRIRDHDDVTLLFGVHAADLTRSAASGGRLGPRAVGLGRTFAAGAIGRQALCRRRRARHRGTAAPRASRPRCRRRAGREWRRRSCSRRSASRSRSLGAASK